MDEATRILKDIFKFEGFKLEQERVIQRLVVQNENALVLFPTGGWSKTLSMSILRFFFKAAKVFATRSQPFASTAVLLWLSAHYLLSCATKSSL